MAAWRGGDKKNEVPIFKAPSANGICASASIKARIGYCDAKFKIDLDNYAIRQTNSEPLHRVCPQRHPKLPAASHLRGAYVPICYLIGSHWEVGCGGSTLLGCLSKRLFDPAFDIRGSRYQAALHLATHVTCRGQNTKWNNQLSSTLSHRTLKKTTTYKYMQASLWINITQHASWVSLWATH